MPDEIRGGCDASLEVRWFLRAEDLRAQEIQRWIEPFVVDAGGGQEKRLAPVFPIVEIKERGKGGLEVKLRIAASPCRSRPAPGASTSAG